MWGQRPGKRDDLARVLEYSIAPEFASSGIASSEVEHYHANPKYEYQRRILQRYEIAGFRIR